MIIDYEGQQYDFEFDDITVKQAMKIEKHTGRPLTEWGDQLETGTDFVALQALGWLILFEGKGAVDDADFKVVRFGNAFTRALAVVAEQQKAAEAKPGPTGDVPASNGRRPDADVPVPSPLSSVPASP